MSCLPTSLDKVQFRALINQEEVILDLEVVILDKRTSTEMRDLVSMLAIEISELTSSETNL